MKLLFNNYFNKNNLIKIAIFFQIFFNLQANANPFNNADFSEPKNKKKELKGNIKSLAPSITGPSTLCSGSSANLELIDCQGTVDWLPGNETTSTIQISPTQTTTYTAFCSTDPTTPYTHTVTVITVNSGTQPQSVDPFKICSNQGGVTFYSVPNQTECPTCTFQWNSNGVPAGTGQTFSITNIGTTLVSLTTTNNGCSATSPVNTVCIYGTTLSATSTNPTCNASNGVITLGSLNSEGHYVLNYTINGVAQPAINFNSSTTGTYILSGLSAGTYVLNVASSGGNSCPTNPVTVTLTSSSDEVPIASGATICEGTSTDLLATGCPTGQITWEGFLGNPINVSPTVMTEYKVTCTTGTCSGSIFVTVNVLPKPTTPNNVNKTNACPVATVSLTDLITANTQLYDNINHTGTALTAAQVSTISIGGTYYLFNVVNGCFSNAATVTVTIIKCDDCTVTPPNITNVNGPCKSININLSAICPNGGEVKWYASNSPMNAIFTGSPFEVNTGTSPTTYFASCKLNATCESTLNQITVTPVDALPAPIISSNASFCGEGQVTLTTDCSGGVRWYDASNFVVATTSSFDTGILTETAIYYAACRNENSNCYGAKGMVTITITPTPKTPLDVTRSNTCPITTVSLADLITASTQLYNNPNHTGTALTAAQVSAITANGTYYLFNVVNGCFSSAATVTVTIVECGGCTLTASTQPDDVNPFILCDVLGGITFYAFPGTSDCPTCTYQWLKDGVAIPGATQPTYTITALGITNISLQVTKGPCVDVSNQNQVIIYDNIYAATSTNPTCDNGSNGIISFTSLIPNVQYLLNYTLNGNPLMKYFTATSTGEYQFTGLSGGTYVLSLAWAGNSACVASPQTIILTDIAPAPIASGSTICQGESAILSASGCPNGTLQWTGLTGNNISVSPLINTDYTVTCTQGKCVGSKTITITVTPKPTTPINITRTNTCPVTTVSLSDLITAGTQLYDNINHTGTALTAAQVSTIATGGTYYLFNVQNGCFSDAATVIVTIIECGGCELKEPIVSTTSNLCKNSSAELNTSCPNGGTPTWYQTSTLTNPIFSGNPYIINNIGTSTKVYYVTCKLNATCESGITVYTITPEDPHPAPTISATPLSFCGVGGEVTLSTNCPANSIVRWYDANGFFMAAGNTFKPIVNQNTTYKASCKIQNSLCDGLFASITINVNAIPATPTNVTKTNTCPVTTVSLADLITASTQLYDNINHSGTALTAAQVSAIATNGTYYLFNVVNGCFSEAATVTVTITTCDDCTLTASTQPNGTDPFSICDGLGGVTFYAIPNTTDCPTCTYQWLNNGFPITGATQSSYNVSAIGITNISVQITNDVCTRTSNQNKVIIFGTTYTANSTNPSCEVGNDGTITLSSLISGGEYLLNYTINGVAQPMKYFTATASGNFILTDLSGGTYVLTLAWAGNSACVANPKTIVLSTGASQPIASDATICQGESTTLNATGCAGGTLQWTGLTGNNIPVSPQINTIYTVTCTQGGCTSSKTITITVTPKPAAPANVNRTNVCPATTVNISDIITAGTRLYTNLGIPLTAAQVSAITTDGVYLLRNVVNDCFSTGATVFVTITECPGCDLKEPIVSTTSNFCKNSSVELSTSCPNGGTPTWYSTNTLTNPIFSGNPFIINNIGTTTKVYYVTCKLNATCESGITVYTITPEDPHPAPTINATPFSFCGVGGEVTLSTNCPANSIVRWYDANGFFIVAGNTFKPIVNQNTTYKASCKISGSLCDGLFGSISINVNTIPTTPSNVTRENPCPAITVSLADLITATTQLYDNPNHSGTALTATQVSAISVGSTYYLFNVQNGCFSNPATVTVNIVVCGCKNLPNVNIATNCIGTQSQIVATVTNIGTPQFKLDAAGIWQSSGVFNNVSPGNHYVYVAFTNNPECIKTILVKVPDCNCKTTFDVTTLCDNAGTSKVSTDDLMRINVNSTGGTGTWTMTSSGGSNLNGTIGTPLLNGYIGNISTSIPNSSINLTFTPNNNPACAVTKIVTVPNACSKDCNLCFTAQNTRCENGKLLFNLVVSGVSATDSWTAIRKTSGTSGPTIAMGTGPTTAAGMPVSINLSDLQNQHGFTLWVMVDGVHDCLGDQYVFVPCKTTEGCNMSGSFSDVIVDNTTNTFTFKVLVTGSGSANGWQGFYNGYTISGNYNQAVTAGPFPVAGGAVGLGIIDKSNPNCIINIGPVSSKCTGDECNDLPLKPTFNAMPASVCSGTNVLIAASCLNGESVVWYSPNGNLVLSNTGTTDLTYTFRAACKKGNCIGEMETKSIVVKPCQNPCTTTPTNLNAIVSCLNNKGKVVITATGLNLQYSIDGINWQNSNIFEGLANATHNFYVRNSTTPLCSATISGTVFCTVPCVIPSNIAISQSCVNGLGNLVVTASGVNLQYKLDNGVWQNSNLFTNVSVSSHVIYVRNFNCQNEVRNKSFLIACACVPVVNTATVTKSCINGKGKITITAQGSNLLYSINNGISYVSTNTFSDLPDGNYTIMIKSQNNACVYIHGQIINIDCFICKKDICVPYKIVKSRFTKR